MVPLRMGRRPADSQPQQTDVMTAHKLIAEVEDRGHAMRVASALQDLLEPPPDALTVFEDKPADGAAPRWRIDAYFSEPREAGALGAELAAAYLKDQYETGSDDYTGWSATALGGIPVQVGSARFGIVGGAGVSRYSSSGWGKNVRLGVEFTVK